MDVADGGRMPTASSPGRTRSAWISIVAFALLASSSTVRAYSSKELEEEEWYGWQNLTIDGVGVVMVSTPLILEAVADASTSSETNGWLFLFGLSTFALGSPIVEPASRRDASLPIGLALRDGGGMLVMHGAL